jgi:hypothetical protein
MHFELTAEATTERSRTACIGNAPNGVLTIMSAIQSPIRSAG